MKSPTFRGGRFSARRKVVAGLLVLLVAYLGYAFYVGLAFTTGIPNSDMDWDGNGVVTGNEIAQSWYAVAVTKTREGRRECSEFHWRSSGESIRVDCRTTMSDAKTD